MTRSKKCPSCKYYAEEYAPYIHATVPVCLYKGESSCSYKRKDKNEPKNS